MRPRVTVVIPCYNGGHVLRLAVLSLIGVAPKSSVEVVVVDDGSDDDTAAVVSDLQTQFPNVRGIHLPRGERSCRSGARNCGARAAEGDTLLFFDVCLRAPVALIDLLSGDEGTVELGLYPPRDNPLLGGSAGGCQSAEMMDPRWAFVEKYGYHLERMPCAWVLGWSGIVAMARGMFDACGGFDEDFRGWGAEDVEFCLRARKRGARFRVLNAPCATRDNSGGLRVYEDRSKSLEENLKLLQLKHESCETELLTCVPQLSIPPLIERFEQMLVRNVVPDYELELLEFVREWCDQSPGPVLLVGAEPGVAAAIEATRMLTPVPDVVRRLEELFPKREVRQALGVRITVPDEHFSAAVVTDLVRPLAPGIQKAILQEVCRVAKRTLLICTKRDSAHSQFMGRIAYRQVTGWVLPTTESTLKLVEMCRLKVKAVYRSLYTDVVQLSANTL